MEKKQDLVLGSNRVLNTFDSHRPSYSFQYVKAELLNIGTSVHISKEHLFFLWTQIYGAQERSISTIHAQYQFERPLQQRSMPPAARPWAPTRRGSEFRWRTWHGVLPMGECERVPSSSKGTTDFFLNVFWCESAGIGSSTHPRRVNTPRLCRTSPSGVPLRHCSYLALCMQEDEL